jgi:TRAP transporter TAXI family solute receptor
MPKSLSRTALALVATGMIGLSSLPAAAEDITFMTGPAGGSWYPLGGAIKNILEEEVADLDVTIRPGAGLINLKGVSGGKAEMGWSLVMSAVDGINGNEPFDAPLKDICNLGSFYDNYLQVTTTDLSANSIADLKGKSLATLPRGNTTELGTRALLKTEGMTYDSMSKVNFASISDGVNMMKDGQVDAMSTITSVPNGSLLDLTNSRDVRFLTITDEQFAHLKSQNPGWQRLTIKANSYPGQEEDVVIAGFPAHLILNCSSVSEELAYNITKALIKRGPDLGTIVKSLTTLDAKKMAVDIGVPMHPGSMRAYKEAGAL